MSTTPIDNSERDIIIIQGGKTLSVQRIGQANSEEVKIALLSSRKSVELYAIDEEEKQLEFVTGKPLEWIEALSPDSHARMVEVMHELNFPVFEARSKRGLKNGRATVEVIRPFMEAVADARRQASSNGTSTPQSASTGP